MIIKALPLLLCLFSYRAAFSGIPGINYLGVALFGLVFVKVIWDFLNLRTFSLNLSPYKFSVLLLFIVLLLFALLTSYVISSIGIVGLAKYLFWLGFTLLFCWVYFLSKYNKQELIENIDYLLLSVVIFIFINFFMYLAGFENVKQIHEYGYGTSAILRSLGIEANRVMFPLASGLNSYGTLLAIGAIYSAAKLTNSSHRIWHLLSLAVAVWSLLLLDSRSALAVAVIGIFVVWLPIHYRIFSLGFKIFIIIIA